MSAIRRHLESRSCFEEFVEFWADDEAHVVTFPLYDITHNLIGYQQYRPDGDKKSHEKECAKYWTHHLPGTSRFWIPKTYDSSKRIVFVQEGIFSATPLVTLGHNVVAILSSDNKDALKNLRIQGHYLIGICDGDQAGKKLSRHLDDAIILPEGEDVGLLFQKGGLEFVQYRAYKLLKGNFNNGTNTIDVP